MTIFLTDKINTLRRYQVTGEVCGIVGLLIEARGISRTLAIGDRCWLLPFQLPKILAEVIGFRGDNALLMPFGSLTGVGFGTKVIPAMQASAIFPDISWLGRVVNAQGAPIDNDGPLAYGMVGYAIQQQAPTAYDRQRVGSKVDLGVRAVNTFVTCCLGQRLGIFAGSGVGKSVLLSMFTRYSQFDVIVIGLVGERGREVQEFLMDDLGPEGRARSIVVVATSDEPPLMRRQAAWLTMSIAEYFRDQGYNVLCMIDSITRFALAQREISLSIGEPPATKGYTPSVFAEIPKLLERAGPGVNSGSITGLFTVLVEGDDTNEPIADTVRGTLDGHIVLERAIAERGRFPAINVLRSLSRMMPQCNTPEQHKLITRARQLLNTYEDMADMIRLGAYRRGSDPRVDEAIFYYPLLEEFLRQDRSERSDFVACYNQLAAILNTPSGTAS
jgi:flagellum-specific ATP synthase